MTIRGVYSVLSSRFQALPCHILLCILYEKAMQELRISKDCATMEC